MAMISSDAACADDAGQPLEEITVVGNGRREDLLAARDAVGSRLGLAVRETPATIDILTQAQMQERGLRTSVEALNAAPGVVAANLPSIPGTASMRGFTGDAVSQLYDGVRQNFMRDFDSWSFDRIEVLKGPASVLYGEGALAGAVNFVPKRPQFDRNAFGALLTYGSYNSIRGAGDVNLALNDKLAVRAVASGSRSESNVDNMKSRLAAGTLSASIRPLDRLTIDLAVDLTRDLYTSVYYGTPLVAAAIARDPSDLVATTNGLVIDRALRDANYNVANGLDSSRAAWARSRLRWDVADGLKLVNDLDFYDARRRWRNSEVFTFAAPTAATPNGSLNRSTTWIDHDNDVLTERVSLASDAAIGGHRNRGTIGAEYSKTNFFNPRRFGTTSALDPYAPVQGLFPTGNNAANFPGAGNRTNFDSHIEVAAAFAEDAFNLTPDWLLVGGARYDHIKLSRSVTDLNLGAFTSFGRTYQPLSWRVGTVYELTPKTQLYAQYNSAVAPVGSLVLISMASAQFNLTTGRSAEAGVKTRLWGDRLDLTAAGYWIEQQDIITRDPNNPNLSVQGGSQSSRGVELSAAMAVTSSLQLDGSIAFVDAKFDKLLEAGNLNRAGNTPPFVSKRVATVNASYRFADAPVSLTGGLRNAGAYYTDNANAIRVRGYTVVDASIAYQLPFGDVTLRGRNLFNEFYATWRGGSATQLLIAPPRSFDVTLAARF